MIDILHLYWIVPLSMAVGAMIIICFCIAYLLHDKRQEERNALEAVDAKIEKI